MKLIFVLCLVLASVAVELDYVALGDTYGRLYLQARRPDEPVDLRWFDQIASDLYADVLDRCQGASARELFWKGVGDCLLSHYEPRKECNDPGTCWAYGPGLPQIPLNIGSWEEWHAAKKKEAEEQERVLVGGTTR